MSEAEGRTEVVCDVRLIGVVVEHFELTSQFHDELIRELRLIQVGDTTEGRLAELTDRLLTEFANFSPALREAVDEAAGQGRVTVDINVAVPVHLRSWLVRFRDHFREIDDYCDAGLLLSLGSPAPTVAFREWFLGQFIEQLDGLQPTPYS